MRKSIAAVALVAAATMTSPFTITAMLPVEDLR